MLRLKWVQLRFGLGIVAAWHAPFVDFKVYPDLGIFSPLAADSILPDLPAYQLETKAQNCEIYQNIVRKTQLELKKIRSEKNELELLIQRRRGMLEKCAREKNVVLNEQNSEQQMAKQCLKYYELWVEPGYRLKVLEEDLQTAQGTLKEAVHLEASQCALETHKTDNSPAD